MGTAPSNLADNAPPLQSVSDLDLIRYTGKWFELARLPNWFQLVAGPHHTVTATYVAHLDSTGRAVESIDVLNQDENNDTGVVISAHGTARPTNPPRGELGVRFTPSLSTPIVSPFETPYWVIDLDEDTYAWAVVSEPTRRFLWILTREMPMDTATLEGILTRLVTEHGFSSDALKTLIWASL